MIGGHSYGGRVAAPHLATDPDDFDGLALWATFPRADTDLSGYSRAVLSIGASDDGIVTESQIEESRAQQPTDARFVEIRRGNHSQFGNYGVQEYDNPASISRADQQKRTVAATCELLALAGERSDPKH